MSSISQAHERLLSGLEADVERLTQNERGVSREHAGKDDGAVRLFVTQNAHGFARRKVVSMSAGGTWDLASSQAGKLWGVVERVAGPNRFTVIIAGRARVDATLTPGGLYTFTAGVPSLVTTAYQGQFNAGNDYPAAYAVDVNHILVSSSLVKDGPLSSAAHYESVYVADTLTIGSVIARVGSTYVGALANPADLERATPLGVLVLPISEASLGMMWWLMLSHGHAYADIEGHFADLGSGERYLSDTVPGGRTLVKPTLSVYVGSFSKWNDPESSWASFSLYFPGTGCAEPVPYPIPASGGGTGGDISLMNENSLLVIRTISGNKQIAGYLNAAPLAFLTQGLSATPVWTTPDTDNSLELTSSVLYARVSGKRTSVTVPTNKYQFLKYDPDSSTWLAFQWYNSTPTTGRMLQVDTAATSGFTEVVSETACSVLGRSANSAGIVAAIAAGADNQILGRRSGVLTWATIATAEIANAAVTRAKLSNGAAVSVIGRSANSSGVPADIAATADSQILGRRSGALTWATIATAEITDAAVTKAKMENGAAVSVIGRSANSAGVTADIAGAANQVLACNGTLSLIHI